jgi:hypothetical protein
VYLVHLILVLVPCDLAQVCITSTVQSPLTSRVQSPLVVSRSVSLGVEFFDENCGLVVT